MSKNNASANKHKSPNNLNNKGAYIIPQRRNTNNPPHGNQVATAKLQTASSSQDARSKAQRGPNVTNPEFVTFMEEMGNEPDEYLSASKRPSKMKKPERDDDYVKVDMTEVKADEKARDKDEQEKNDKEWKHVEYDSESGYETD